MQHRTSTRHVRSAILYNKLKSIGKIEVYEKKIGLNSDRKRFWPENLESLQDDKRCDSVPYNINTIEDIVADKSNMEWIDELDDRYEPESDI